MARTVFDCARVPGKTCTLQIIGDEKDVIPAAQQHMVSAHGKRRGKALEANVANAIKEHAKQYSTWV